MIKVTLKDGSVREFENELSVMDIAKSISEGLARAVVAASVNGKVVGLNHIVKEDCELNLFKFDDEEGKDVFEHYMQILKDSFYSGDCYIEWHEQFYNYCIENIQCQLSSKESAQQMVIDMINRRRKFFCEKASYKKMSKELYTL
mgnify:CR=1 FL=1